MIENIYRRDVFDEDGDVLRVSVPYGLNEGKIRVITHPHVGRPAWLTLRQAEEARDALDEAIFAAREQLRVNEQADTELRRTLGLVP